VIDWRRCTGPAVPLAERFDIGGEADLIDLKAGSVSGPAFCLFSGNPGPIFFVLPGGTSRQVHPYFRRDRKGMIQAENAGIVVALCGGTLSF
jgi:hypothetical protein